MPADSSWKTPVVSPDASSSKVVASSSGMCVEVDVDRRGCRGRGRPPGGGSSGSRGPRKSNLSRPSASMACISYWVISAVRVGRLLERHQLGQRLAADDDAGGVGRGVAGDALEVAREVDDPLDRRVGVDHARAASGDDLERLVEPDAELVRDGLGDAVDLAVASGPAPGRRRGSPPGPASCRR